MELTQVKGGFFGYKKADVIKYISELNEQHTAQLDAKNDEIEALKKEYSEKTEEFNQKNSGLEEKIAELEAMIETLKEELNENIAGLKSVTDEYEVLKAETDDLRNKSEFISTAIINAEKCAGQVMDQAREKADDMIRNAEDKVRVERDRLNRAKDYVRQARADLKNTMNDIDSALLIAEAELEKKEKSIDISETKQEKKIDIGIFKRA